MATPNIDLAEICPELAGILELIECGGTDCIDPGKQDFKDDMNAIAATMLAQQAKINKLAAENERLKTELGFKYGKQCQCGHTVYVIPNECQDGSL